MTHTRQTVFRLCSIVESIVLHALRHLIFEFVVCESVLKGDWGCGIDVGPGDHLEPFVLGLGLNGDGGCGIDAGQVDYGRGGVV